MNKLLMVFCVIAVSTLSVFSTPEPWWHDAQLEWKPFTALPVIDNPHNDFWYWTIQERASNENPKFFAQAVIYQSPGKFLVANASVTPSFTEPMTNLSFGIGYPGITARATSSAMVKWNKPYEEFFIGTSSGIRRFDEDLGHYVTEWDWYWDPVYIASLGDKIFGAVPNFGSGSGYHIWDPINGDNFYYHGPVSNYVWADPVSGRYEGGDDIVRVVSTNFSIRTTYRGSLGFKYSFNGGEFLGDVGTRNDGLSLYVEDFYVYSNTNIIIKTWSNNGDVILVGNLGGTFYSINFPTNIYMKTFFYSPTTRLLIAGDATKDKLYSAVLPGPDEILGPKLNLQPAFIISWESKYGITNLESTTSLTTGNWTTVTAPQNNVGDKVQVAVPQVQQMFFRLTSP